MESNQANRISPKDKLLTLECENYAGCIEGLPFTSKYNILFINTLNKIVAERVGFVS